MLIKYTGSKPVKTVNYNNLEFVFIAVEGEGGAPVCEVKDVATLKFLLGADMKGLFVPATPNTSKDDKAREEEAEASRKASEELSRRVEELEEKNNALKEDNKALKEENKVLAKKLKDKK